MVTKFQITDTLNIKKSDVPKFTVLFFHSFFVYIFISFFFVPANSVFIHHFGAEYLPYAYIAAGITGYLTSLLYSELQKRVQSKILFLTAISFMVILPVICRLLVDQIDERILSFIVFIWAWPFISLVNVESGGLTIGLLNLRQVKRLFGLINIGGIISSIISYFAIPVIMPFLSHTYDLLYVSLAGTIPAFILILIIYKRFPDNTSKEKIKQQKDTSASFKTLFKERYFTLILVSATLSMVVLYFVDFGYLSSIKEQSALLSTPAQVSNFIALVCGAFKIGELISSYLSNRLLSKYGVKMGLSILPIVLSMLILFALIAGFTLGTISIVFFAFVVLSKSFERILRRGLDDPSFNILYQPLSSKMKLAVQTRVGIVMQFAIGIAGVLLLGVSYILKTSEGFQLKYYTLFFFPILVIWVYITRQLFLEYRKRLRQILADMSRDKKRDITSYSYGDDILKKKLKKFNADTVRMSVTILSETNPKVLEPYASSLLEIENDTIRKGILRNIDPSWRKRIRSSAEKISNSEAGPEVKKLAELVCFSLDFDPVKDLNEEQVFELIKSKKLEDRITVIKYLTKNKTDKDEELILQLLGDEHRIIITGALELIPRRNSPVLNQKVIEILSMEQYSHSASNVILNIGDKILPEIEKQFNRKSPLILLFHLVEILAKMGSTSAKSILVKNINFPARDIQINVIRALYFCRYQASGNEVAIIRKKLEETIENISWNLATIIDLESEKNTLKLIQSLDLERENNYELIFELLSFLYDPKVINLIKKNIIGENTIFALEIIDNFINQDQKQIIIPLFDDISKYQRLKKLANYYPQKRLKLSERLKDIITRDYFNVDPWTIAKSVELLGKLQKKKKSIDIKDAHEDDSEHIELWTSENVNKLLKAIRKSEMPDEVFVCLYHPDEIVYSTAAQIIFDENQSRCLNYLKTLSPKKQELIPILQDNIRLKYEFLPNKIKYLKRLSTFFSIPENLLVKIAKLIQVRELSPEETLSLSNGNSEDVFFIVSGMLSLGEDDSDENKKQFSSDDVIIRGVNTFTNTNELIVEKKAIVLVANRYEYFNMLMSETGIINHMFEMIQIRK